MQASIRDQARSKKKQKMKIIQYCIFIRPYYKEKNILYIDRNRELAYGGRAPACLSLE